MTAKPIRSALLSGPFADLKGRGARSNRESRFSTAVHDRDPEYLEYARLERAHDGARGVDGVAPVDLEPGPGVPPLRTHVTHERARSIISRNQSPDIPFEQSINPYRGCEHGCVYCYARPSHAYLGLSAGVDFETQLYAKDNAAELLAHELRKPGYRPALIALGANTDPYQPLEKDLRITRAVLQVLADFHHPVAITTKSALVLRDLDLLQRLAGENLVRVFLSVGSLDRRLARTLEPRASTPALRIEAMRTLAQAGVPAGVIAAPMIPGLTDADLEAVLEAAATAGARHAGYVLLRLPLEVRDLFVEWLEEFAPLRAGYVMSLVRQTRAGQDYRSGFGTRMTGTGTYAALLRRRFELACRRLNLQGERQPLDTRRFAVPGATAGQQSLF